jgi:hypothetical protein
MREFGAGRSRTYVPFVSRDIRIATAEALFRWSSFLRRAGRSMVPPTFHHRRKRS